MASSSLREAYASSFVVGPGSKKKHKKSRQGRGPERELFSAQGSSLLREAARVDFVSGPPKTQIADLQGPRPRREAGADASAAYDPQTEYKMMLDAMDAKGQFGSGADRRSGGSSQAAAMDPYQHLMTREKRVLDTVNRMATVRTEERAQQETIFGASLATHAQRAVATLRGLLDDIVAIRRPEQLLDILRHSVLQDNQRRLYIGSTLVIIAIVVTAMVSE